MARRPESRLSLILALSALIYGGCAETGTAGQSRSYGGAGERANQPAGGSSGQGGERAADGGTPSLADGGSLASAGAAAAVSSGGAQNAGGVASGDAGAGAYPTVPFVYVGSTNGQISIFTLDAALGKLTLLKSVAAGDYPSFLAFDPSYAHLFAVNEADAKVASFSVDPKTGDLALLNRVNSGGASPAHVSVDRSGKFLLVANYGAGTTRIFSIRSDGSLGGLTDSQAPGENSHMFVTDPGNQFAFVVNKGSDTITQYAFDATSGTLTPNAVPTVTTPAGAGPRHLAFHPNGKFAFVIAETDDTLAAYAYDEQLGRLSFLESKSTLPSGEDGDANTCAEVVVAPSGKFVYGSNRGHDSIVRFSIDSETGGLTFIDTTPSGGNVPRSFTLSADGELMLVANESGNVTSFSVNTKSGALTKLTSLDVPQKPQFVGIAYLR